jgi:UDP-N-acetylglucosamine transferase subunit ALG13
MKVRGTAVFSVGTDHHRFDRLIEWSEQWAAQNPEMTVVVQHGFSRPPLGVVAHELMPRDELFALFARADVVVAHAGGGTVMECWRAGTVPIVVTRLGIRREHVDDHQVAFSRRVAELGYVTVAESYDELCQAIAHRLSLEPERRPRVDIHGANETTGTIGRMIEDMLGGQQRRGHRFFR